MAKIGDAIRFVDAYAVGHPALITQIWGPAESETPCVNLLIVSKDESKTDQYGRQVERYTSVVHQSSTPAPGYFWTSLV